MRRHHESGKSVRSRHVEQRFLTISADGNASRRCFATLLPLLLLSSLLASSPAASAESRRIELRAAGLDSPVGNIDSPRLTLAETGEADALLMEVSAPRIVIADWGYRFDAPHWQCRLNLAADRQGCAGTLRTKGHATATLNVRLQDQESEISLSVAKAAITIRLPADGSAFPIRFDSVPLGWLQPVLGVRWPEASFTNGRLSADLTYVDAATATLRGQLSIDQFGLDTSAGLIAAAGLSIDGALSMQMQPSRTSIEWKGSLRGGEWLYDPLYVAMPDSPIALDLALDVGDGEWHVERLQWDDPGTLVLQASGRLRPDDTDWLPTLRLQVESGSLQQATPRYFDSLLAVAGLAGLRLDGGLTATVQLADSQLDAVDATLSSINSRDADQRFAIENADGRLHWRRQGSAEPSSLSAQSAMLYGIELGAATLSLSSTDGSITLKQPMQALILGGVLRLDSFDWRPAMVAGSDQAYRLGLRLENLDMSRLSRALDWPELGGTLSGRIPSATYADGVLRFDGGLNFDVFDGRISLDNLSLERPFGVAPTLAADLLLESLDLVPLTRSLGFGEISGRLQGAVNGLRLVDWSPVAFDADLHTSTTAKDKRRISQRAVDDLSSVGGSGIAAGLQARVLQVFDTFGYAQIGLKCRLENNICHMDGLDSSPTGYTIVKGSGLPRISVVGHQREVDWPVLLARLEAATAGQTPVVR